MALAVSGLVGMIVMLVIVIVMRVAATASLAMGMIVRVGMIVGMIVVVRCVARLARRRAADMDHIVLVMMRMVAVIMAAAAGLAMRVIMMRVVRMTVIMMTMIVMVMIMVTVVVMAVVVVAMRLGGLIGAALRLERRLDDGDRGAEPARHLLQHRIAGDADAVGKQLRRHMAVAEMPGKPRQMMRIPGDDLRHRLLGGDHRHHAPVFQRDAVAVLHPGGFGEIEQEHDIALPAHGDAAAVPPVMRQDHLVGGDGRIPAAGGNKRASADHGRLLN
ncbi:hypothetical protein J2X65_005019 [Ancylobacter sp. 3268]|nr:hypothetical protein [Ancylobacter sp. 3268]